MAKRVIKNGKYNIITCSDCGCEFSFDYVDIEADQKVVCPQCKTRNTPTIKNEVQQVAEAVEDEVETE